MAVSNEQRPLGPQRDHHGRPSPVGEYGRGGRRISRAAELMGLAFVGRQDRMEGQQLGVDGPRGSRIQDDPNVVLTSPACRGKDGSIADLEAQQSDGTLRDPGAGQLVLDHGLIEVRVGAWRYGDLVLPCGVDHDEG